MSRKRIVVVTGGGSGIGRATAKRFAEDGDFVVVADINEESAQTAAEDIAAAGGYASHITVDVAKDSSVGAFAGAGGDASSISRRHRRSRRSPSTPTLPPRQRSAT